MNNDYQQILSDWKSRCEIAQKGHYMTSESRIRWHYTIGILLIITAATLGMLQLNVFSSWEYLSILKVVLGVVSTIFANIQVFFDFNTKAANHQIAATEYGKLKRKIEILLLFSHNRNIDTELTELRMNWDNIATNSPVTPKRFVMKSKKIVECRNDL